MQRSLLLFDSAIKSEATRRNYKYHLEKFRQWAKVKDYDALLQGPKNQLQILVEDYAMYLKSRLSPNSVPASFAPIELFYVMNDIQLNFKKIRKLFPEKIKKSNDKPYTRSQIQKLAFGNISLRSKALVLLLASSGIRIGAIPDIRLKHMTKIEDGYAILIYEGTTNEDYGFTTPEAAKAIDEYLEKRRKDKEYFDENTPLFRARYRLGIEKVKPWALADMMQAINRIVKQLDRKKVSKTRYEIATDHGFRKFFSTVIKNTAGIKPIMTEKLINHIGVVQLDGSYFKPTMNEMYDAYKLAIPELTISDEERTKAENRKLQKDKSELEKQKEETQAMKQSFEEKLAKTKQEIEDKIAERDEMVLWYIEHYTKPDRRKNQKTS